MTLTRRRLDDHLQEPQPLPAALLGEGEDVLQWRLRNDHEVHALGGVRRTLTRVGGKVSLGEPKTKKSRRSVNLTAAAMEVLESHLSQQLEEMERIGSLYQPDGLVFANESSGIINPSNLRNRSFARLIKRAGLSKICFHDLRHTCATLLLSRNVNPKIVSEMLGHSSISITLDTYSHVLPIMQENAIRALEDALKNNVGASRCCTVAAQTPFWYSGLYLIFKFYLQITVFKEWNRGDWNP